MFGTAWKWLVTVVDLSIPDMLSIFCTIAFPAYRWWKSVDQPRLELLIADLLRGAAFSTFVIVIFMALSRSFMTTAYEHNRVVLFLAGVIGAAAVIKADKWLVEFFRELPKDQDQLEAPRSVPTTTPPPN